MNIKYFAGIDIGSNAIRLLLKRGYPDEPQLPLEKVQLIRVPIRLGEDVFIEGKISKTKRKHLISLMTAYREIMSIFDVVAYRACATSAMREATNGKKIAAEIGKSTGIKIDIITGKEEARLVGDIRLRLATPKNKSVLFVDVGGGSTELNLFSEGRLLSSGSFPIGTVRMLEGKVENGIYDAFIDVLSKIAAEYEDIVVIGTGGNINKLVRLGENALSTEKERYISTADLHALFDELAPLEFTERMRRFNLKPDRADVIVPAAQIFLSVVDTLKAKGISVPTSGLADGIIDDLFTNYVKEQNSLEP